MRDVTICYGMTETSPVSFQTCTEGELFVVLYERDSSSAAVLLGASCAAASHHQLCRLLHFAGRRCATIWLHVALRRRPV